MADSAPFIEFTLDRILVAFSDSTPEVTPEVAPEVSKLLQLLNTQAELSRMEIQKLLQLKDEKNMRLRYITPALNNNWIELTIPNKPNSRLQKYRITTLGRNVV